MNVKNMTFYIRALKYIKIKQLDVKFWNKINAASCPIEKWDVVGPPKKMYPMFTKHKYKFESYFL